MREAIRLMRHAISLMRHAISPFLAQRVPGVDERRGAVVSTCILGQGLRAWKPLNVPIEAFGSSLRGNQMGTPLMSQSKHLEVRSEAIRWAHL